jgi:hypothetical protein
MASNRKNDYLATLRETRLAYVRAIATLDQMIAESAATLERIKAESAIPLVEIDTSFDSIFEPTFTDAELESIFA